MYGLCSVLAGERERERELYKSAAWLAGTDVINLTWRLDLHTERQGRQ